MHQSGAAGELVPRRRVKSAAGLYLALFAVLVVLMEAVELAIQAKEAQEFPRVPGVLHERFISFTQCLGFCRKHMQDPLNDSIQVHCHQKCTAMLS